MVNKELLEKLTNYVNSEEGKKQLKDNRDKAEETIKYLYDNSKVNLEDLNRPFNV